MNSNRVTKRRHLVYYLDVFDRITNEKIGSLGDLNRKGIMILSTKKIEADQQLFVKVKLPEKHQFREEYLHLDLYLKWIKTDLNPDLYCLGCEIDEISSEDSILIEQLIEIVGFNDEELEE